MFSATLSVGASLSSWKIIRTPAARARAGVQAAVRLLADAHLARVGLVVAGEDADERRLAGAVLAEQHEHLAGAGVEVDAVEDLDAAERLADLAQAQHFNAG